MTRVAAETLGKQPQSRKQTRSVMHF